MSDGGKAVRFDGTAWQNLADHKNDHLFFESWLSLQSRILRSALNGVVVVVDEVEQDLRPAAYWPPEAIPDKDLIEIAEAAVRRRTGIIRRNSVNDVETQSIAYPILIDGEVAGVVGFNVQPGSDVMLQSALRQLQWGSVWLESHIKGKQYNLVHGAASRLSTALDLVAVSLEYDEFGPAASATLTEVASQIHCERASFGVVSNRHIKILAISHTAVFSRRMNLVRAISSAMEEAVDQERLIVSPSSDENIAVTRCHEELARRYGFAGPVLTVPLYDDRRIYGALTLEFHPDRLLEQDDVELVTALGTTVGRVLEMKRKESRWLGVKVLLSMQRQLHRLLGAGYLGRKIAVIAIAALVLFFSTVTSTFRVTTDATLEGRIQRMLVAPYDGYIAEANIRAGDKVSRGQVLAKLDDRDLRLELEAWASRKKQYLAERQRVVANHDMAQANVFKSQIDEADVQIALLNEKIERAIIVSPFNGIVLSGDLTQSLGRGVQMGDTLFQVAPHESYRIFLKVDERDIEEVAPEQTGSLLLNSMPHDPFAFTVTKISSVTLSEEGINMFRVEGLLDITPKGIRPGMEGVAKISINEQKLVWIWSRSFLNWIRIQYYKWWL